MLESRPSPSPGTILGLLLIAGLLLLDFGLLILIISEPITLMSFFWGLLFLASIVAIAFVGFWTSSLSATRYLVDGDVLIIEWGRLRQVVPMDQIRYLVPGETIDRVTGFRGVRWPGCFVGHGYVSSKDGRITDQETLFYATRPIGQQLILATDSVCYALSPFDLVNFADCLRALPIPETSESEDMPTPVLGFLRWRIWQDQGALTALMLAVGLNALLFAFLCASYRFLPALVPIHFDRYGVVDVIGSPAKLLVLPFLGLFTWMFNGALGWFLYQEQDERPTSLILWGAAVAVQLISWVAVGGLLVS